jgi:Concanavalin A-like lectin/glucanases superfamily
VQYAAAAMVAGGVDRVQTRTSDGGAAINWSDPAYAGWTQSPGSPCASSSGTPDRLILDVTHNQYLTTSRYPDPVGFMDGVIRNYVMTARSRHPSAVSIVLQPVIGGPNHQTCTSSDSSAEMGLNRASFNHPVIHQAILQVVGGDVTMGYDSAVRTCNDYFDWVGHIHPDAYSPIGSAIGIYYRDLPLTVTPTVGSAGGPPTATPTPMPPTDLPTATPSPTSTPGGPTNTPTSTLTRTPTATVTNTPIPGAAFSLQLNGTTGYAQAPHAAELAVSNWTFELWFKDEHPSGYNHASRGRLLTKGEITGTEVPLFASIQSNVLTVGLRSGGNAQVLTFNLATGGVSAGAWHHLAATFNSSTRQLTITSTASSGRRTFSPASVPAIAWR